MIGAAALAVLCIIGWALLRSRREQEAERLQIRHWDELAQSLGDASATGEVSGRARSRSVDGIPGRPRDRCRARGRPLGPDGLDVRARRCRTGSRVTTVRRRDRRARVRRDRSRRALGDELEPVLGQSITELEPATRSLYGLPLRTQAGRPAGSMTLLLPDDRPIGGRRGVARSSPMPSMRRERWTGAPPRARARRRDRAAAQPAARGPAGDRGARLRGPLQRRRCRARGRRRLVRRRAAAGRDPPPDRRRRRRARHSGRGADGAAAERLSRPGLRPHLARRDRPPADAPRAARRHGDRRLPHDRSLHGRGRLRLHRSSPVAAPRRRDGRGHAPRSGKRAAARLGRGGGDPRRRGSPCRRTAPCSPTRTASSSVAA